MACGWFVRGGYRLHDCQSGVTRASSAPLVRIFAAFIPTDQLCQAPEKEQPAYRIRLGEQFVLVELSPDGERAFCSHYASLSADKPASAYTFPASYLQGWKAAFDVSALAHLYPDRPDKDNDPRWRMVRASPKSAPVNARFVPGFVGNDPVFIFKNPHTLPAIVTFHGRWGAFVLNQQVIYMRTDYLQLEEAAS